jgi:hypothetical protein
MLITAPLRAIKVGQQLMVNMTRPVTLVSIIVFQSDVLAFARAPCRAPSRRC